MPFTTPSSVLLSSLFLLKSAGSHDGNFGRRSRRRRRRRRRRNVL
jgi:hypothetical protein